ncbi:MAG: AMP phosphorylase [Desulfurococcaceae archaeon]
MRVSQQRTVILDLLDLRAPEPLVVINEEDVLRLGVAGSEKVLVGLGDKYAVARLLTTKTMTPPGKILASEDVARSLRASRGQELYVLPLQLPKSYPALIKRIRGERLSQEEFVELISDVVKGSYGEAEIAAFLLSQLYLTMNDDELTSLIKAMVETGEKVKFDEVVYDEHSIGGVPGNSKVAMIVVPTVAAFGLLIPKTSSRAITSPAGTADTMEVLARVDLTAEEIKEVATKTRGTLAWGGKLNLAPADDIFVNVERRLSIDPWHQMVASILSKKLAMGVQRLVLDIPVGRKAKVEDVETAHQLAGLFIRQASRLGVVVRVALTFGGQPIGTSVGPALEAREALESLMNGRGSRSLVDKAMLIAAMLIEMSGKVPPGGGEEVARKIFEGGKSYEKFKQIVEAQGGNPNVKPEEIPLGKHSYTIRSHMEGAVTHIDNAAITMIARAAGAPGDKGAGVQLHAKVGYRVNKGDPLITIYSNSYPRLEDALSLIEKYPPMIVEGMLLKVLP